ncbi:helical backbone metal receptor [Pinibacter aurantiacus]|uniref:Helical backbone metal receptor n=1 Tax=Pinibacter aurantiacus TaxID=2851599 RepID=A0A9E2SFI7_9BACT|nr:helical backbone metal receptor [Pinibacter aurantiacus]MBV4359320.1 helical backbone metal receptor [Pinibacter aurantiacus]
MHFFTDQTGNTISLANLPKRIISLVPSQTELLYTLELNEEVVGITKFCVHPEIWFHAKTRVGGTKDVKFDIIEQLNPDLILANKEENVKEQIEYLSGKFSVWVSDVEDMKSACDMILQIGSMTGKDAIANDLTNTIIKGFSELHSLVPSTKIPVGYLIWKDPLMTVGGDTFINNMLDACGFQNVFASQKRYPEITVEDIRNSSCKVLFLSSEPYPFKQKHIDELQKELPDVVIKLVDGEMFSWYGSRMLLAIDYFECLVKEVSLICSH